MPPTQYHFLELQSRMDSNKFELRVAMRTAMIWSKIKEYDFIANTVDVKYFN